MSQILGGLGLPVLLSIFSLRRHLPNQADLFDVCRCGNLKDPSKTVLTIINDFLTVVHKRSRAILKMLNITKILPCHFLKLIQAMVTAKYQVHLVARVILLVEFL